MREIVLDTETTGLDPEAGDRVVEIGCVELANRMPTGRVFHRYLNPERAMPAEAEAVHGLSGAFLADKPVFAAVAAEFVDFLGDADLVIHNASFDLKFLNAELRRAERPALDPGRAVDTLAIARRKYPGAQNSLDALCRRFGVDSSRREKHGALLDCELLAEVYLELTGGRQPDFGLAAAPSEAAPAGGGAAAGEDDEWRAPARPAPLAPRLTEAERARHEAFVEELGEDAFWRRFGGG